MEAIQCFLVQSYTAASMLLIRSVEYGIQQLYIHYTKKRVEDKTWGVMIKALKLKIDNSKKKEKRFFDYLDYLRDKRNLLQHPPEQMTLEEAEIVLLHTKEVLVKIYRTIG